jgi:ubiquinone/menaquinone biosynthesis C-methylase UbiE
MILDVGSGIIDDKHMVFLKKDNTIHVDISRKAFHVEVVCDAHHLPFRNGTFHVVHARSILESLEHPLAALKECKRVAAHMIIVKVPNSAYMDATLSEPAGHLYSWNAQTLKNICERAFSPDPVKVYPNRRIPQQLGKVKKYYNWLMGKLFGKSELTAVCRIYNATCS